ncbi:hypothetical protein [Mycobacterium kyogaense]|uniref:hypothetical protein n=1 Tax=Mycobacterium kyogaense TaxID=2212479 RepID=UPI0013C4AB8D|nr:hypothetical protein [Mycobacterium kyogaense]
MTEVAFPIGIVAYEINVGTRELEQLCGDVMVRNEYGMRCIPGDVVRDLIAERGAKLDAEREARRRDAEDLAEMSEVKNTRRRIRALRAKQERLGTDGDAELSQGAMAAVTFEHHTERMDRAGLAWQEQKDGTGTYHRISERE